MVLLRARRLNEHWKTEVLMKALIDEHEEHGSTSMYRVHGSPLLSKPPQPRSLAARTMMAVHQVVSSSTGQDADAKTG